MTRLRLWPWLALALLAAAPAGAHRGHDAFSSVVFDKDGRILVTHRLEASDLEPALAVIAPDAQASLDDPAALAGILAYLSSRFRLSGDGRPIILSAAGSQLGGAIVQFSFVGRTKSVPDKLTVTSQILTDIHPTQVNQVNIRRGKTVQTLTFRQGGSQTVIMK